MLWRPVSVNHSEGDWTHLILLQYFRSLNDLSQVSTKALDYEQPKIVDDLSNLRAEKKKSSITNETQRAEKERDGKHHLGPKGRVLGTSRQGHLH